MMNKRIYNNQTIQQDFLFKNQRNYRKADNARKEPAKEYEHIKKLVEESVEENIIKNADYDKPSKNINLIAHQKNKNIIKYKK